MKTFDTLKSGDKIGIRNTDGTAARIASIHGLADGCIHVKAWKGTYRFDMAGREIAYNRNNERVRGQSLDLNIELIQTELNQRQADNLAEHVKRDALRASPEYRLAATFINSAEPEISIEAFSKLGIEKLQNIAAWLSQV